MAAPRPVHPRLPLATAARQEAQFVFRELLRARGVRPQAPGAPAAAVVAAAAAAGPLVPFEPPLPVVKAALAPARRTLDPLVSGGIALVVAAAIVGALLVRRRRPGESGPPA